MRCRLKNKSISPGSMPQTMRSSVGRANSHVTGLTIDALMHVFGICDTKTLLSCARACTAFQTVVASEFRVRYAALLGRFFGNDLRPFNGLLRLYGGIVLGSVALAFFAWPIDWEPGDLDIYVGDKAYDAFVLDFYRLFPVALDADMSSRHPGRYTGIKGVRRYLTLEGRRIDVIRSASPNPAQPLLYFWSTVVVNFITPQGAVCAYPKGTLSGTGLADDSAPSDKVVAARAKYNRRGFEFTTVQTWHPADHPLLDGRRVFTTEVLLFVDFDKVWARRRQELPIIRTSHGSALKSPPLREPSDPPSLQATQTSLRPASLDRSQSFAVRGATPSDAEARLHLDACDFRYTTGLESPSRGTPPVL